MPLFDKGGQPKFSMNPQVGKAMYGNPSAGASAPPTTGLEAPGEELKEPTLITCPDCGAQIELTAAPKAEESEGESATFAEPSDEEAGEQ
jgi:hypothetical protein